MKDLERYRRIGKAFIDTLRLITYPIAAKLIRSDEDAPTDALHPREVFGSEVPACLVYTWCRRTAFSFYLTKEDIACKPIVIYFGLDTLTDPEDLYRSWEKHAGYKRDTEAEKRSREKDARLEPLEFKGIVVSPLHETIVRPDLAMIFCSPLALSHLILAATFDGTNITSNFNGMESSCKEGIIRTYKTKDCQVVSPGMGDRVLGGVQDNEMLFSIPERYLESVMNNLFKAGEKISPHPFKIPHVVATLGANNLFGQPVEPGVWNELRAKFTEKKEE